MIRNIFGKSYNIEAWKLEQIADKVQENLNNAYNEGLEDGRKEINFKENCEAYKEGFKKGVEEGQKLIKNKYTPFSKC